ncbi:hypothetical protein BKI52_37295 [marine bacterium AO1-C]|nr:hypothetical protein BKI52_37295 [marine bacterium AO1-C]
MKRSLLIYCFLLFATTLVAQIQSKPPLKEKFQQSKAQWAKLQKQCKQTYAYTLLNSAHGRKVETRVVVQNGLVTAALATTTIPNRATQRTAFAPNASRRILTLDEIYQDVEKRIWPAAGQNLKITYNDKGILQNAGYERVGCKGDCYEGYRIKNISLQLGIQEQIIVSMVKWEQQKAKWNNTYYFIAISGGKAQGFRSERTIYVRNGEIIKVAEVRDDYKANTSSRRLYTRAERRKTGTLDAFYTYALTKVASVSPDKKDLFFKTGESGFVSLVGTATKNCEGDCFTGYTIARIRTF